MPTLGEELKHKREQRGITLAEIAEATRIGTRFLKAIETDNFSILPGGIFTRSFIRAYAKYVGMNEEDAIGLYIQQVAGPAVEQQESQAQPVAAAAPALQKPKKASPVANRPTPIADQPRRFEPVAYRQSRTRTNWSTIVIGAGILIFIVLIALALVKRFNRSASESGSQASAEQKNAPPPKTGAQSNSSPQAKSEPSPQTERPGGSQSAAGEPLVVKLEAATGESWVKYQVDDAKATTLILKQGESQDLPPAQRQVTLNCGNRLTLKMKINNRDANFPPDTPKFKSKIVISRDNLQTFFQ
jgi:cytoskeleton protein RodZ